MLFRIKVERVQIFYGHPVLTFNFPIKICIGWIPLGGFIDPDFGEQPKWQKLLMVAGGCLFNLIVIIILFYSNNYSFTQALSDPWIRINLFLLSNILPIQGLDGYIIYRNIFKK